jgi:hypothetical protein
MPNMQLDMLEYPPKDEGLVCGRSKYTVPVSLPPSSIRKRKAERSDSTRSKGLKKDLKKAV